MVVPHQEVVHALDSFKIRYDGKGLNSLKTLLDQIGDLAEAGDPVRVEELIKEFPVDFINPEGAKTLPLREQVQAKSLYTFAELANEHHCEFTMNGWRRFVTQYLDTTFLLNPETYQPGGRLKHLTQCECCRKKKKADLERQRLLNLIQKRIDDKIREEEEQKVAEKERFKALRQKEIERQKKAEKKQRQRERKLFGSCPSQSSSRN